MATQVGNGGETSRDHHHHSAGEEVGGVGGKERRGASPFSHKPATNASGSANTWLLFEGAAYLNTGWEDKGPLSGSLGVQRDDPKQRLPSSFPLLSPLLHLLHQDFSPCLQNRIKTSLSSASVRLSVCGQQYSLISDLLG